MEGFRLDFTTARLMAEALAIGLLVGIERYKGRTPGEKSFAGVRTFTVFALLGGVAGLVDRPAFVLSIFAALALLVVVGYSRERGLGLTTEAAALLVFWLGYLVFHVEALAISIAIVLTLLLASKQAIHGFVRESISERELFDTLKFLAVVLVVYPLLPDRDLGPYLFFNPSETWLFVVLVAALGFAGYLGMRLLGERPGLLVAALLGGVVSSTAATMALAARARKSARAEPLFGLAAVAANAVQPLKLAALIWIVEAGLGRRVLLPLAAMSLTGFLGAWALWRRSRRAAGGTGATRLLELSNPFSLTPVLQFAVVLTAVLFLVAAAEARLGDRGVYVASALGGGASASAVALSLAERLRDGGLEPATSVVALWLAIFTNALVKWAVCFFRAPRTMALWLGGGLALMLVAGGVFFLLAAS